MEIADKVIIVTGGASGIGKALCERFANRGARGVIVADIDEDGAEAVARATGGYAMTANVSSESDNQALVDFALETFGRVDMFCFNAGVASEGGPEAIDEVWNAAFNVNLRAHVYGLRAVLPSMVKNGEGHLLFTSSAAGLLLDLGSAPYTATKHAVVGLAEWVAVRYGDQGIGVSCLCPEGVKTPLLDDYDAPLAQFLKENALEPNEVARAAIKGIRAGQFLILPHPEVKDRVHLRAADPDRYLRRMRKLRKKLYESA
ncbi:MAG: SDR family oxidoreductase [Planctomycetota bacterium]|jgi:NAD(P)-dependent dehydrogenase (short-subunit alcohol dehydrogenase family)